MSIYGVNISATISYFMPVVVTAVVCVVGSYATSIFKARSSEPDLRQASAERAAYTAVEASISSVHSARAEVNALIGDHITQGGGLYDPQFQMSLMQTEAYSKLFNAVLDYKIDLSEYNDVTGKEELSIFDDEGFLHGSPAQNALWQQIQEIQQQLIGIDLPRMPISGG